MKTIRWGILGAGGITRNWMNGAKQVPNMEVVAVASRTRASAEKLAQEYGIPFVEDSCEALVKRDDIDVVYVASPHSEHASLGILALENGKAVLSEKPLTANLAQAKAMFEAAQKAKLFLMEGMWTRFFPGFLKARELIMNGAIGDVRAIDATFAFRTELTDKEHRLLSPKLAGGGLMDVGIYCLHFCQGMLMQMPTDVVGLCSVNTDEQKYNVDEQAMMVLRFPGQVLASLKCAVKTYMGDGATIYGTKGQLYFPKFWAPEEFVLRVDGEETIFHLPVEQFDKQYKNVGFSYEIAHVNDCLRQGVAESDEVTRDITLGLMAICDDMRKQWGIHFPCDTNH